MAFLKNYVVHLHKYLNYFMCVLFKFMKQPYSKNVIIY